MEFSNITFDKVIAYNSIDNSLQESIREIGLLDINSNIKPNNIKSMLRRFLQTIFEVQQRENLVILDTMLGVRQKKFKNKTLIEVSNPQTDYKFFRKI